MNFNIKKWHSHVTDEEIVKQYKKLAKWKMKSIGSLVYLLFLIITYGIFFYIFCRLSGFEQYKLVLLYISVIWAVLGSVALIQFGAFCVEATSVKTNGLYVVTCMCESATPRVAKGSVPRFFDLQVSVNRTIISFFNTNPLSSNFEKGHYITLVAPSEKSRIGSVIVLDEAYPAYIDNVSHLEQMEELEQKRLEKQERIERIEELKTLLLEGANEKENVLKYNGDELNEQCKVRFAEGARKILDGKFVDDTNNNIEKNGVIKPCEIYMEFSKKQFHWLDEDAQEEFWGTYRIGKDGALYIITKEWYDDGKKMQVDQKEKKLGYYYDGMILSKVKRRKNGSCVILDDYYKIDGNRYYEKEFGSNKRKGSHYKEKGEVKIENNMYMLFEDGEKRPETCYFVMEEQWFEIRFRKKSK